MAGEVREDAAAREARVKAEADALAARLKAQRLEQEAAAKRAQERNQG